MLKELDCWFPLPPGIKHLEAICMPLFCKASCVRHAFVATNHEKHLTFSCLLISLLGAYMMSCIKWHVWSVPYSILTCPYGEIHKVISYSNLELLSGFRDSVWVSISWSHSTRKIEVKYLPNSLLHYGCLILRICHCNDDFAILEPLKFPSTTGIVRIASLVESC